ncbi:TK3 [Carcinus maenas nudivirus]|uniref:TK3 n=1 Tax=Carcinus maenas nudivirus TaxID=2880837 RepID=A0AAE8Y180_9VIRU|nr:TK3 [Carcinus maenas nudivirus]UBZ25623.1 TK3 [Carcinus maenas nudivirus]
MEGRLYLEYNHDDPNNQKTFEEKQNKTINNYWINMGFINSQHFHTLNPIYSKGDIYQDIMESNAKFFGHPRDPKIPIYSLDGTCCTGKTSLVGKYPNIKTNTSLNSIGMNTNPASALGYYFSSLKLMNEFVNENKLIDDLIFSDRTPWNNFLWALIWKLLAVMSAENVSIQAKMGYSNSYTYMNALENNTLVYSDYVLNLWSQIMDSVHTEVWLELINTTIPIFLVDSNEDDVYKRLIQRNTGSDLERSKWVHYIAVQNYAYTYLAQKFPKHICIIDINRYKNMNHADVLEAVEDVLKNYNMLDYSNWTPLKFDEDNTNMFPCAKFNNTGKRYQRLRPIAMDSFYSHLKRAYADNQDIGSSNKKQKI